MKRLSLCAALLAALAFTPACLSTIAEAPTSEAAVTGPYPENYEEIVRNWILEDNFRVVSIDSMEVSKPVAGVSKRLVLSNVQGWRCEVAFWGRDRIGTSTGKMDYTVLIRDGEVASSQKHP